MNAWKAGHGAVHARRAVAATYDELWRWSVDDVGGFWAALWERFGVGQRL